MLIKIIIAVICGVIGYLLFTWLKVDHILAVAFGLGVGVLVFAYGP